VTRFPESAAPGPEPLVGAVLCGGASSRFGSDKAVAPVGDGTLGASVVAALRQAGVDPVVAIGGDSGPAIGVPVVADLRPGEGPLGGLATALLWAKSGYVVVVPCDLPLLQPSHLAVVIEAAAAGARASPPVAAIATIDGEPQVSVGCWPASAGRTVLRALNGGQRRFRSALDVVEWIGVELPPDALSDADTPAELRRLLDNR
jgi:molybdopterin-guanine dinucleotide biosynthesis protein A